MKTLRSSSPRSRSLRRPAPLTYLFQKTDLTRNCLESVYRHTHTPFNLIIIDNGSKAETKDFLKAFVSLQKNVIIIRNEYNLGWVKAVNQGMRRAVSPYLCIMNND